MVISPWLLVLKMIHNYDHLFPNFINFAHQELGFESLQQRRWYRKLRSFYKVFKNESLRYLFNIIPNRKLACSTRNHVNISLFKTNHNFLKNSFFPSTIIEWNSLYPNLRNSVTYETFKNSIVKFIRPSPNSIFKCHNQQGIKFLITLRLGLSHLREHKFKHSFQDSLNHYVSAVLKLNQLHISCSTVPYTIMIGPPSLALLETLIANY